MKTIAERAKEAGIISQYKSDYRYDKRSVESGYTQGAIEQKAIDIDKVCDWLKENVWSFAHSFDGNPYYDTEMMINALVTAMEE